MLLISLEDAGIRGHSRRNRVRSALNREFYHHGGLLSIDFGQIRIKRAFCK